MWEYKCGLIGDLKRDDIKDVQASLNAMAAEGWRLVTVTPAKYGLCGIFERERGGVGVVNSDAADNRIEQALAGASDKLRGLLAAAREKGDWDGTYVQLEAIAWGYQQIKGIGPKRQAQLREVIAEL